MTNLLKFAGAALALTLTASPLAAGNLKFQAVQPTGLDAKAAQMVKSLQQGLPGQMAAFEAQGYKHYGAIAVPQGVALKPELLSSVANLDSKDAARNGVLKACKSQTGRSCTVIGYLVPAGG